MQGNGSICSKSWLSELIDTYQKLVFSICYKVTEDYFAAEDLSQETFLSVYQKYDTFDGNNEKAWICRIAVNKSIDYVRSSVKRNIPTEDSFFEVMTEGRDGPEEQCVETEIKSGFAQICDSLKPPYDEIARAYYLQEKTVAEIARDRSMNSKTIQTQIYRARDMLKKKYRREDLK